MTRADPSPRRAVMAGLAALVVLGLGFGLWAGTAPLSGAVIAPGRVVAAGQNLAVQHPDGGRVAEVLVTEGGKVAAGQVLIRLDGSLLRSDLAVVRTRLAELRARIARLEAERDGAAQPDFPAGLLALAATDPDVAAQLDGQRSLLAARAATEGQLQAQLRHRAAQGRAEIAGLAAQRAALADLIRITEVDLARQTALADRGLVPQAALQALAREAARLAGEAGRLDAAAAAAADRVAEIGMQVAGLGAERREAAVAELRDLWPAVLELEERQRNLARQIAGLDLRAPIAGRILGLRVTAPGAVLSPAEPALHVVPEAPPVVLARVAPRDRTRVTAGQEADMVFRHLGAEPLTRITGRVVQVSADTMPDPVSGEVFYEVTLSLPPLAAANLAIGPGLEAEVYLRTGEATPISYLVAPLGRYLDRAWREG